MTIQARQTERREAEATPVAPTAVRPERRPAAVDTT